MDNLMVVSTSPYPMKSGRCTSMYSLREKSMLNTVAQKVPPLF